MITGGDGDRRPSLKRRLLRGAGLLGLAASLLFTTGAGSQTGMTPGDLDGVWRSRGYGMVVQVTHDAVRVIERTPVSCLPIRKYSKNRFLSRFDVRPNREDGTFAIHNEATLNPITFERLDAGGFDRLCRSGLTPRSDDPELNFEVLWHTFAQHYAFFPTRNVDWNAVYAAFRPRVDEETTESELGKVFEEMLEGFGDAHVSLNIDGENVVSVRSRLSKRLRAECREQKGADCDFNDYMDERYVSFEKILRNTYLKRQFRTALGESVIWGRINETTGYLRVDSMAGLVRGRDSAKADLAALKPVLDDIVEDLGHLPGMIVDVRLNGGGDDTVALAIAGRFTDTRRVFGSKRAFEGGQWKTSQDLVLEPADGPRYHGRVAVLTSGETASAAEVFALAMRSLPRVTLVGEKTMGIFSDELYRQLPNGWRLSLSNETYLTPDGKSFEATGIPPDILAPVLSQEDSKNGVDSVIEAAIATLKQSGK
jgi:carboxyl-terminal processing protease